MLVRYTVYRAGNFPLKYIVIDLSDTRLTPYVDACGLLKRFTELYVELNEAKSEKRIVVHEGLSYKVIENTSDFAVDDSDFIKNQITLGSIVYVLNAARRKENIEDAVEHARRYIKFDENVVALLYKARSVIELVSYDDSCYTINL